MPEEGTNSPAGLREAFAEFYRPGRDEFSDMVRHGMVVLDTNALLDLYRFTMGARSELLGVLTRIGDRLWVPYRVALEFYRGRVGVIAERTTAPLETVAELEKIEELAISKIGAFGNRFGLGPDALSGLTRGVRTAFGAAMASMRDAHENYDLSLASIDDDPILESLEVLLHGRIGLKPADEEVEDARKVAERRIKEGAPPGYRDAGKDKERAAGDSLWWLELVKEASKRRLPVLLVTNESKEDFIVRVHGQTIGPRPELKEELSRKAGVPFHIINTRSLLLNARELLDAAVSDSTLAETSITEPQEPEITVDDENLDEWVSSRLQETPKRRPLNEQMLIDRRADILEIFPSALRDSITVTGRNQDAIHVRVADSDFDIKNIPKSLIAKLLVAASRGNYSIFVRNPNSPFSLTVSRRETWYITPDSK